MLREFAAIGLSRYTGQLSASQLIGQILKDEHLKGHAYLKNKEPWVEILYDMGPFQLVMRGRAVGNRYINVTQALPALKEKRGYMLLDWESRLTDEGEVLVIGQEALSMEETCLSLTETYRYWREQETWQQEMLYVSCYGMSVEGKILLGSFRTEDEKKQSEQSENWRRSMMQRAMEGDTAAMEAIEKEEGLVDEEIARRMEKEDIYTIFDGFMYPAGNEEGLIDNTYTLLGDIKEVDKLFNPFSEEWVYYLGLSVLGQELRVLINPTDLVGQPAPGRRFQGKVRLYGRLDPARLILENNDTFF